jgi:hypothetical protein
LVRYRNATYFNIPMLNVECVLAFVKDQSYGIVVTGFLQERLSICSRRETDESIFKLLLTCANADLQRYCTYYTYM